MTPARLHHLSHVALCALSSGALLIVLTGYLPGHGPQADEGTAAHLFQLAIVLLAPVGLLFAGTADWTRPATIGRRLALPIVATVAAFAALYYLEHVFYPAHY
jgi:hypothetical protein